MSSMRNLVLQASTALGASFNGTGISVDKNCGFAIAAVVDTSSSLSGSLKLQGSIDPVKYVADVASTSWGDVTGITQSITADGCYLYLIDRHQLRWVRLVWTRTGGTGNVTQTFNENE